METLIDLLEDAAARYGGRAGARPAPDDGVDVALVIRRGRAAEPDRGVAPAGARASSRVTGCSRGRPSTPALPAAYFGAMYRGAGASSRSTRG